MKRHLAILIPILFLLFSTPALHAQEPTFLIESVRVDGTSRTSSGRIISESYINPGATVSEREIELAVRRVQRLSFVYEVTARLERGASQGSYVLVFEVVEVSPLFINATVDQTANYDITSETAIAGYRWFVGDQNVVYGAVGHNTHYTTAYAGWTRYGLFGGRGWAVLDLSSDVGESGFDATAAELQINRPLRKNDGVRIRAAYKNALLRSVNLPSNLGTERFSSEGGQLELGWYRDTTDDPLLPTRGTSTWIGLGASTGRDHSIRRLDEPAGEVLERRSSGETYSATASVKGYRPISGLVSVFGGAAASYQEAGGGRYSASPEPSFPQIRLDHGVTAGVSMGASGQFWSDQRNTRLGDLRWEVGTNAFYWWQEFEALSAPGEPGPPWWIRPSSGWGGTYSVGLAYRHRYGLLRLTFSGSESFR